MVAEDLIDGRAGRSGVPAACARFANAKRRSGNRWAFVRWVRFAVTAQVSSKNCLTRGVSA